MTQWEDLPVEQQERVMGRTKLDSIELENKPSDSQGEGALGFFLAILLSWLCMSTLAWLAIYGITRIARAARTRA